MLLPQTWGPWTLPSKGIIDDYKLRTTLEFSKASPKLRTSIVGSLLDSEYCKGLSEDQLISVAEAMVEFVAAQSDDFLTELDSHTTEKDENAPVINDQDIEDFFKENPGYL